MINKKLANFFYITIIVVFFLRCSQKDKVDSKAIENIAKYEKIKDILLSIMGEINFEKAPLAKEGTIVGMNLESLEKIVLPQNRAIETELKQVLKTWKSVHGESELSALGLYKDSTIEFTIKSYHPVLFDSSYSHSIIYDPKNHYRKGCSECQDLFLLKTIKGVWKYVICRAGFG
jgi:hypothetical protein